MLGTSDAWWTSHLSQGTSEPAYYIVDCPNLGQELPQLIDAKADERDYP